MVKMLAAARFRHEGVDLRVGDPFETDEANAADLEKMSFAERDLRTGEEPRRMPAHASYQNTAVQTRPRRLRYRRKKG